MPIYDRDYYRCMQDELLIEAGRDSGHELCIALAERLEEFINGEGPTQLVQHANYLETEVDRLRALVDELNDELTLANED